MARCVAGPTLIVSALLLASACDTERAPTTSNPSFPPTDGGVGGQGATDGGGLALPDEELVSHTLPALSVAEHQCVSGFDEPNTPSLHVIDERLFLFFNASTGQPYETALYLQTTSANAVSFDAAREVHHDAYQADLVRDGTTLWAAVAGGFLSSFVVSSTDDGASWQHQHTVPAGNDSPSCSYQVPLLFFRPLQSDFKMALGYDVDSHIFGCSHQIYYSRLAGGDWTEPVAVGQGTPGGAVVDGTRLVVGSTGGLYVADAADGAFAEVPGGERTDQQLRGNRMVQDDSGRLLMAHAFEYASESKVALLIGTDGGTTWTHKLIVNRPAADVYAIEPWVVVADNLVVVAWLAGDRNDVSGSEYRYYATVTYSPDGGATWSEPARFDQKPDDQNLARISIATDGSRIFGGYGASGESRYYDFTDVCVAALEP